MTVALNPPDLSRGHAPLLGLFLANPGVRLTEDEIRAVFPDWSGRQSVRCRLTGTLRAGRLMYEDGVYYAPDPFPLSTQETQDRNWQRWGDKKAAARNATPQTGATVASRRGRGIEALAVKVLALLEKRGGYLSTAQIAAALKRGGPLLSEAMSELVAAQRVRVRYDVGQATKGAPASYAAPLARVPQSNAPARGRRQVAVLGIVRQHRALTYGALEALVCAELDLTPERARELIETLYQAWRLNLRVVGNTYVVTVAPAYTTLALTRAA